MKRLTILAALAVALQFTGCVPSVHPLYTSEDVVFEKSLLGEWSEPGSKETFAFTREGEKSYQLVYTNPQGRKGRFLVHLVRIEGHLFLDFFPERKLDRQKDNVFYEAHFLPMHSFMRVAEITPTLQMAPMNPNWLDKFLKEHPDAIGYEATDKGFVLTASTEKLQAFVLEHLETEDAWGELTDLKRNDDDESER